MDVLDEGVRIRMRMQINLIASVYMSEDDMPALIVSCKEYDRIAKEGIGADEIEVWGLGKTAEEAHAKIYQSIGLTLKKEGGKNELINHDLSLSRRRNCSLADQRLHPNGCKNKNDTECSGRDRYYDLATASVWGVGLYGADAPLIQIKDIIPIVVNKIISQLKRRKK
jgi:hypothetical protein